MLPYAFVVDDPIFLEHRAVGHHPERPERLLAARRALQAAATDIAFVKLDGRDATADELLRVHTEDYLRSLGQAAGRTTMLDADTYVSPRSVDAARRAAGASVVLVERVLGQGATLGVALVRPPGHHALPSRAMGFCLLNNAAIAAAAARARGVERVLILDWDVHHGNGTQDIFFGDPQVLYVSVHQSPYYPGTGDANEVGGGPGEGFTVNIPLTAGAGDAVYAAAFERIVLPIAEQYRPELTLVSAGFDAHERDPLGGMTLTDAGYFSMAAKLRAVVSGPVVVLLEGGYDLAGLEGGLASALRGFAGRLPAEIDRSGTCAPREFELSRAVSAQAEFWRL